MVEDILFVTDIDKKLSGGVKQLLYNILGLTSRGYKVYLACRRESKLLDMARDSVEDVFYLEFENYRLDGKKLAEYIGLKQIDVVHTFHNKGHKVGLWAKIQQLGRFKLFVNRGVSFTPTNIFYYPHPKIDGFICNSKDVANKLGRIFIPKKKRNVIYNAFEMEVGDFHSSTLCNFNENDGNKTRLVTICNEAKWKGFDLTLKSLSKLTSDFRFYVIGMDEIAKFRQLVAPHLEKNMEVLGRRTDIIPLLSKMDIFVYTPRAGDSCPNVILEAMYGGLPVVATKVGGIPELIVDGEGGFVAKNIKDIIDNLELLIKNERLRKSMGEYNKKRVSFFSLERKIDSLIKVYNGETVWEDIE